jgi:hypothetical protein
MCGASTRDGDSKTYLSIRAAPCCGEAHEVKGYDALMRLHEADPSKLLSDKGYVSDDIRSDLIDRGIEPVIPP